jgi:hypothetical protein
LPANTSTDGIAFINGVNRSGNRQLWIGDSASFAVNSTNLLLRIYVNSSACGIDCLATDGNTNKQLILGNTGGLLLNGTVKSVGDILLPNTIASCLGWDGQTASLGRAATAAAYSTDAVAGDVV